ncbi:mechanosensitive ion channel family protein [Neptunicella sp. SCSIO 80796]|uniref:mechanosensitive ion channel family protein n=1 Tax=Neptunicella plasticusilytica TaxID=3117012 RepID=UPI003A4E53D8
MNLDYVLILLVVVGFFITRRWLNLLFTKLVSTKQATIQRKLMVRQLVLIAHSVLFLILATLVLGIDYGQFTVFLSSTFAVLGIALFAQWSILSNLTAGVLIFFNFPYRVGDYIKVANKDYDLVGIIEEISSFHVLIRHINGDLITYPNSLILQTPVIKLSYPPVNEDKAALPAQHTDKP